MYRKYIKSPLAKTTGLKVKLDREGNRLRQATLVISDKWFIFDVNKKKRKNVNNLAKHLKRKP